MQGGDIHFDVSQGTAAAPGLAAAGFYLTVDVFCRGTQRAQYFQVTDHFHRFNQGFHQVGAGFNIGIVIADAIPGELKLVA